jgi:integrase
MQVNLKPQAVTVEPNQEEIGSTRLISGLVSVVLGGILSVAAFATARTQFASDVPVMAVEALDSDVEPLPLGLQFPFSLTFERNFQTILPATAKTRRKGFKVMSRRCQLGTEVVEGNMYRLRVRVDVPGEGRIQKSFPICPVSGPRSLNKKERMRKRMEIVAEYNSQDYLKKVVAHETGTTFKAQSILWMSNCQSRKRKPMKPVTLVNWQSYLDNHILPFLGSQPIAEVNNASMKTLVEVLVGKGLAPQSIKNICLVVKLMKASAVDENGDELYPMKWNTEFIDAPVVDARKQNTPSLTGEEVTKILAAIEAEMRTLFILDAATGLRAGELLGLEIRHFDGRSIKVEQSVWRSDVQAPKTQNAYRIVDLHPDVAKLLSEFIGDRKSGYIFCTSKGKPLGQSNILRRSLHPVLEKLGIKRCGFHALRRFRNTYLRNYTSCPNGLRNFWLGWSGKDMSDHYDKIREDAAFRREVAERVGIGFELPKPSIVPSVGNVPNSPQEVELVTP